MKCSEPKFMAIIPPLGDKILQEVCPTISSDTQACFSHGINPSPYEKTAE